MENEKIDVYREYSRIAREEGYDELASLFNGIANILFTHADSFDTAAFDLETGQLYCRTNEAIWICLGCGNVLTGECAPELCPICGVPGSFYQLVTYYE
jgi:rubrerythrin